MNREETYEFYREQTLLLTEEYKELKERIDKAITYINEADNITIVNFIYKDIVGDINRKILLNILKGEDKE